MWLIKCVVFIVVFNFTSALEDVETGDNLQYQFFPTTESSLQFKVRARNDAHIALSKHPMESDSMYEIVIGAWGNTRSMIKKRVCSQPDKNEKLTPQYLSEEEFRSFWLSWDKGRVTVGRDGEAQPFLSWRDPDPFPISFGGVHTGYGSAGSWKLENCSEDATAQERYEVKTEDNTEYKFFPVSGKMLRFMVRARNDAHIALTSHPWKSAPMYEIIIGGWANSRSVIRRRFCYLLEKDAVKTPKILNKDEFRSFWSRWENGIVMVGRAGEAGPFLSWRDPGPFKVGFVGVHTGYGSNGTWKLGDAPSENSNVDNEVAEEVEVATGDVTTYQFFPVHGTSTQFKVHAGHDAHIALTTMPRESGPQYELAIGGWGNAKSVIRRMICVPWDKDIVRTPGIMSSGENRGFWIRWDNATVMVGREGEEKPFMSWHDLEPVNVTHIGVHTGFGSTGTWEIDNVIGSAGPKGSSFPRQRLYGIYHDQEDIPTIPRSAVRTEDNTDYQFFPISSNLVTFRVQANSDAHVGLSSERRETDPMYEILIGGWANTQSRLRRKSCFRKAEKSEVSTFNFLDEFEFRGFWVSWDNGVIQVGKDGESYPFMSWQDVDPIKVTHIGFHTGYDSDGIWKIPNESRNDEEDEISTAENTQYQFFPRLKKAMNFKVRTRSDAHVGLTTGAQESDPMYEIVIGGWSNQKSVIRKRCCLPAEKVEVPTPDILSDSGYRGFWISWDKGNVMAGREGETSPFMKWNDPEPFPINYLGVHTGYGASGTWKIGKGTSTAVGASHNNKPAVSPLLVPVATPAPAVCGATLTRLRQGTACAGQVIFEENFDTLRENIWQVQQYVALDHPELPFISYQRSTVSVKDGNLRITPALQHAQPGFTYYSLYGSLDLYNGCTSGQTSHCQVEASGGSSILPPVIGGRITSRSSFAFTYGIISVRAKLPQGDWIFPEILLEPLLKKFVYGTKNSGMLKIACARGNLELSKSTTQYGNKILYSGPVIDTKCHDTLIVTKKSDKHWGDDFHVYSAKWTPDSVTLFVDGQEYGRIEPGSDGLRAQLPKICAGPHQPGMAPFDDHFYIALGVAVGGHTEFPDASLSKGHKKPWRNHASKATLNFWSDMGAWRDTWDSPKLLVDYVKVVAL